jgi:hypothetical protein
MTIRNFWRIFLKAMGIWIIISSITVGINYISAFASVYNDWDSTTLAGLLFLSIFSIGIFYLVILFFLFKTEWLIDRLKLDKGFENEKIDIAISSQTFIAVVIALFGGIYLADALPDLCKSLISFYQQEYIFRQSPGAGKILFYFVQSVTGYVLLTNSKFLSKTLIKKTNDEPKSIEE